jgi:hypothetical protein
MITDMKKIVLQILNEKIKPLINPDLYCELTKLIDQASDNEFNERVTTSLDVLKTLDVDVGNRINNDELYWQSEELLESLKDSDETDNSIQNVLIKLELLLFPLLNYAQIPIPASNVENIHRAMPTELRETFLSELMDAVLDDVAEYLTKSTEKNFDWFYEFDVFDEVIFRLRNPKLFTGKSNDDLDRVYVHIKIKLTKKYAFSQHQIAQLLADQFHYIGPDTVRGYLDEFIKKYPIHSDHTLNNFFKFKPELNSIFNDKDMKRFRRLFGIYCNKLQRKASVSSVESKTTSASVKIVGARHRQKEYQKQRTYTGNGFLKNLLHHDELYLSI